MLFVQLSLFELPEPDWSEAEKTSVVSITELKFNLDETVKSEIERVKKDCDDRVSYIYYNFRYCPWLFICGTILSMNNKMM